MDRINTILIKGISNVPLFQTNRPILIFDID